MTGIDKASFSEDRLFHKVQSPIKIIKIWMQNVSFTIIKRSTSNFHQEHTKSKIVKCDLYGQTKETLD